MMLKVLDKLKRWKLIYIYNKINCCDYTITYKIQDIDEINFKPGLPIMIDISKIYNTDDDMTTKATKFGLSLGLSEIKPDKSVLCFSSDVPETDRDVIISIFDAQYSYLQIPKKHYTKEINGFTEKTEKIEKILFKKNISDILQMTD